MFGLDPQNIDIFYTSPSHFKMHIDLHAFCLIYIMSCVFAVDTFLTHVIKHELTPHEMYTGTKTQPKAIRKNTA